MSKPWKTKEERTEEMEQISKQLEEGVKQFFTSETYKDYLKTMSKFHNYSFNNVLLIALQRPSASLVAGYTTWRNLNRFVMKGEKGIRILAPAPIKREVEREVIDPLTKSRIKETVEQTIPLFKPTYVYDVSQTDGEPLKLPEILDLEGSVDGYEILKEAAERIAPVPVFYEKFPGEAKGYFSPGESKIVIQNSLSELQTVKTLLHEVTHSILHNKEKMKENGPKDSKTKEVEAESTAFTVCTHLGLDTSDYSFPYVGIWAGGMEMPELRNVMDGIRTTAADMIENLDREIQEIRKERAIDAVANELVEFGEMLDPYDYLDYSHDRETAIREMKDNLFIQGPANLIREIQDIIREQDIEEVTRIGGKLIQNLTQLKEEMEVKTNVKTRQKEAEAR